MIGVKQFFVMLIDQWATKIAFAWVIVSCVIGIAFVQLDLAIALPLMTLFMFFSSCWGLYGMLLIFQKMNPKINQQLFKLSIGFFYCFGLIACIFMLFSGLLNWGDSAAYGAITSSIFPLGVSLGASKMLEHIKIVEVPRV